MACTNEGAHRFGAAPALQPAARRADPPAMALRSRAWMRFYYAATLVFALADWLAGANVRAVGFAAWPELRTLYYAACGLCGLVTWRAPTWSAPVTLLESSVNVTVLCASVLAPSYLFALHGGHESLPSLPQLALNFLISGTAGTLAFYQALARLGTPRRTTR
jgi:hypothetical protein